MLLFPLSFRPPLTSFTAVSKGHFNFKYRSLSFSSLFSSPKKNLPSPQIKIKVETLSSKRFDHASSELFAKKIVNFHIPTPSWQGKVLFLASIIPNSDSSGNNLF